MQQFNSSCIRMPFCLRLLIWNLIGGCYFGAVACHSISSLNLNLPPAVRNFSIPSSAAWVYSVAVKPDNGRYIFKAIVTSISSLCATNTSYDILVLLDISHVDSRQRAALRRWKDILYGLGVTKVLNVFSDFKHLSRSIAAAFLTVNKNTHQPWVGVWNKILAWSLFQYDKVAVVDMDVVFWRNPDVAMLYPELSAVPDYAMSLYMPTDKIHNAFNAGFMVLQPEKDTFRKLVQLVVDRGSAGWPLGPVKVEGLEEQYALNVFFNQQWFQLPAGFNIFANIWFAEQISMNMGISRQADIDGIISVHHIGSLKVDYFRDEEQCSQTQCTLCCRKAVMYRERGLAKLNGLAALNAY